MVHNPESSPIEVGSASYYLQGFSTIPSGDRWILAINRYVYDKLLLLCHLHESRKTLEENFGNKHGWWAPCETLACRNLWI